MPRLSSWHLRLAPCLPKDALLPKVEITSESMRLDADAILTVASSLEEASNNAVTDRFRGPT